MRSAKIWKVSRRGVAAGRAEGKSLCARLAPSSGTQGSNGIQRRKRRPRMDKQEREFRLRGTGNRVVEGGRLMRFAGMDVGAERHMVAMVGEDGEVLCRSSPFGEDASGYAHLFELLGPPEGLSGGLGSDRTLLAQSICRFVSKGLRRRRAESVAHATLCRGGASEDQDRRDRCAGNRAVRGPEAAAVGATT